MTLSHMNVLDELAARKYTLPEARRIMDKAQQDGVTQTGGFWLEWSEETGYVLTSKAPGYRFR